MMVLLCTFLFILSSFFFYVSYRSLKINRNYEKFFANSAEDISNVVGGLNEILLKRPLLSDDQDVQKLVKGFQLAQEILISYVNVKNSQREEKNIRQ